MFLLGRISRIAPHLFADTQTKATFQQALPQPAMNGGWRQGPAVSAGGGRGLGPALKEPLRVIAHIDMDAFYAQIEQVSPPSAR